MASRAFIVKLLLYSHYFAPSVGGVETSVESLAQGLHEARSSEMSVTVVTQTAIGAFDDGVFSFPVVRRPTLKKLWRLIRQSHIVHIAGPSLAPLFFAFVARRPFVVEHHGYQSICPNGSLTYSPERTICPGHFQAHRYWKCLRCRNCELSALQSLSSLLLMFPRLWLVRRAAKNLAITRHVMERNKLPRSEVVYYGIDDPRVKRNPGRSASDPRNTISFAFVGRFVSEKGIPILLQAARQLAIEGRTFAVSLIGDGPDRAMLESLIRRDHLENHVSITGYLRGPKLTQALSEVHVVVMPSVCEETAGLAAIEQMMRGRLVIASKIGGLAEVIGSTGLCFAPGSAEALTNCMRRVLQEPGLIETLGREARIRALSLFARRRMIDDHRLLYRMVLENAATSARQDLPQTSVR
jgi:glycosyltransferase involved in cell wall biosynthesis